MPENISFPSAFFTAVYSVFLVGAVEQTPHHSYPDKIVGKDTHLQGAYTLDPVVATEGIGMRTGGISHQKALAAQAIGKCGVTHSPDDKGHATARHEGVADLKTEVEHKLSILIVSVTLLTAVAHNESALVVAIARSGMLVEALAGKTIDHGVTINPHAHIVGVAIVVVGYLCLDVPHLAFLDNGLQYGPACASTQEQGADESREDGFHGLRK